MGRSDSMPETVVIPRRFNGPPDTGHGGYSCAVAARFIEGPAEVALKAPPPLERELGVEREDGLVRLLDGDRVVAEARPAEVDVGDPPVVSAAEARAASERSAFLLDSHPFPTCFACGPRREHDDGLRIFAGPVGDGAFADTWTPTEELAAPEFVWAALDCPSSAPAISPERFEKFGPFVLARLAVRIDALPAPGEEHVVVAWSLEGAEHKQQSAVALLDPDGTPLAVGRALWIGLRGRPVPV